MRWRVALLAVSWCAGAGAAHAQGEPVAPVAKVRPLAAIARRVAETGREKETRELLQVMEALGYPEKNLSSLVKDCESKLGRSRKPSASKVRGIVKSLRRAIDKLADELSQAEPSSRQPLARALIRLDGDLAAAREALGHRNDEGRWVPREFAEFAARNAEFQAMLQEARRLEIDVDVSHSDHPLFEAVYGRSAVLVRWGKLRVVSAWSAEKTVRCVRAAARASAVCRWLLERKLEPFEDVPTVLVQLGSRPAFLRALDHLAESKVFTPEKAALHRGLGAAWYDEREGVQFSYTEAECQSYLTSILVIDRVQPCLFAGYLNWVCQASLGTSIPLMAWTEYAQSERDGRTAAGGHADPERVEYLRVAEAGLRGCREYMTWLTRRGEDPPWSRSMVAELAMVRGEDLLKSTMVFEFLALQGPLSELFDAAQDTAARTASERLALMSKLLGEPVADFEDRWRRWMTMDDVGGGLIAGLVPAEVDPQHSAVLLHMQEIRATAFARARLRDAVPLGVQPSLCDGARAHARYLNLNPDQLRSWPEAHEQFDDRDGYTVEGAWAAGNSVVAGGVRDPLDAIDAWMSTFYHRLPLLDPGLVRIGWGFEDGTAVMDTGSLVRELPKWVVTWPPAGMEDVPCRFAPEMPNPVPGADQAAWGYPITLQVGSHVMSGENEVQMTLFKGEIDDGVRIDCHYSTPSVPTNPDLAPRGAYCLMPKAHLEPNTDYSVRAELDDGDTITWTFRTGTR